MQSSNTSAIPSNIGMMSSMNSQSAPFLGLPVSRPRAPRVDTLINPVLHPAFLHPFYAAQLAALRPHLSSTNSTTSCRDAPSNVKPKSFTIDAILGGSALHTPAVAAGTTQASEIDESDNVRSRLYHVNNISEVQRNALQERNHRARLNPYMNSFHPSSALRPNSRSGSKTNKKRLHIQHNRSANVNSHDIGGEGDWKGGKTKRVRTIFTPDQLERLEAEFERQQYMVGTERYYLASSLNLSEAQVKVWFQNRRIKWRKQNIEHQQARMAEFNETCEAHIGQDGNAFEDEEGNVMSGVEEDSDGASAEADTDDPEVVDADYSNRDLETSLYALPYSNDKQGNSDGVDFRYTLEQGQLSDNITERNNQLDAKKDVVHESSETAS